MLFFDVFSSCCGGGKTREVKLLHLTDEERFKLAESYTKASLPNNKHFCSILTNNFKPQVEPHFGSNRDAKDWMKAEKKRRLRAIDRALKEYQESMPSKSNEGEHLKSIKRVCYSNLMKVSQAQLVQVAAVIIQVNAEGCVITFSFPLESMHYPRPVSNKVSSQQLQVIQLQTRLLLSASL